MKTIFFLFSFVILLTYLFQFSTQNIVVPTMCGAQNCTSTIPQDLTFCKPWLERLVSRNETL